ncbi:MAG: SAM-dependent chlorinase/fluorinase [Candidatus Diapherotrites archaeon]|uniref:SAM-dependent chlorinase/fluorinase n=1 Tax=Candidatus Iainarchaeum sp. TaxID=3101447 RepID=A0A8T4L6Z1_9ARCH|nr:SAM-dependent chlorinase/fluorinase [Candidatus Diapherotrites archaeon]
MPKHKPLVSFSTDFGPGNRGHGVMKAVILERCPDAEVVELATNVEGFDLRDGAKNFEGLAWLPKGIHICVVDPGVGTQRRGLIIETGRGDYLVGPDNGVLLPAASFVGDVKRAWHITNQEYLRQPVSHVFHGRDVFASVAGHLAAGVKPQEIGVEVGAGSLAPAPYPEACAENGRISAEIIHVNAFGNVSFNIRNEALHQLVSLDDLITLTKGKQKIALPYKKTFGEVAAGTGLIFDGDFGRVEAALNQGSLAAKAGLKTADRVTLAKC